VEKLKYYEALEAYKLENIVFRWSTQVVGTFIYM